MADFEAVAIPVAAGVPPMLGDYTLLTKLASGGMATVYVARKHGIAGFERLLAIKCCHPHLREDEEFSTMFLDEARLAASIRHPNVVATLDVSDGDHLYMVMEYIEGYSLATLIKHAIKSGVKIPPAIAVRVMIDVLQGLHAAHELRDAKGEMLGLVHRDVSPQNILIGIDGISRITDFGIAFAAARASVTQEGRIKGKFSYLSPEQARSQPATRRMDVFSAGIVLWEALTTRGLFRRKEESATITAVLSAPIPPPSSVVPELPKELDEAVLRALQRDPGARYQSAAEFAEALEKLPIEGVTPRSVGAYMHEVFGAKLAERRELIRLAPEQQQAAYDTHPRAKAPGKSSSSSDRVSGSVPVESDEWSEPTLSLATREPGDDIQHRRLRGVLAATMLLLVGSALGLLLARSSPAEPAAAPAPSAQGPPLAK
ncbi:MAG TPA: serine/threonine-protein kinase [Polyangiaceae bacterium]